MASALHAARLPPAAAGDPTHAVRPLAAACVLLDYLQVSVCLLILTLNENNSRLSRFDNYKLLLIVCTIINYIDLI